VQDVGPSSMVFLIFIAVIRRFDERQIKSHKIQNRGLCH
jgi:hypothetical protein